MTRPRSDEDPISTSQRLRAHRLQQAEDDLELAKRRADDAHTEFEQAARRFEEARRQDEFDSAIWWMVTLARWTVSTRPPPPAPPPKPKPPPSPIARPLPRIPLQRTQLSWRRPPPVQQPPRTPRRPT